MTSPHKLYVTVQESEQLIEPEGHGHDIEYLPIEAGRTTVTCKKCGLSFTWDVQRSLGEAYNSRIVMEQIRSTVNNSDPEPIICDERLIYLVHNR